MNTGARLGSARSDWLDAASGEAADDTLRLAPRTGRPCGHGSFLRAFEEKLDLTLSPMKPGPKPESDANQTGACSSETLIRPNSSGAVPRIPRPFHFDEWRSCFNSDDKHNVLYWAWRLDINGFFPLTKSMRDNDKMHSRRSIAYLHLLAFIVPYIRNIQTLSAWRRWRRGAESLLPECELIHGVPTMLMQEGYGYNDEFWLGSSASAYLSFQAPRVNTGVVIEVVTLLIEECPEDMRMRLERVMNFRVSASPSPA